ncbi:MAG: di-heme oxidoredictase family protein [Gemmatimonadota bacterium]
MGFRALCGAHHRCSFPAGAAPARLALLGLAVFAVACAPPAPLLVEAEPGAHLPGLSTEERALFEAGRALFTQPFTPAQGLGPLFNQTQCSSCHDLPTSGGHGAEPVRKATRYEAASGCDLLEDAGGDLLQAYVTAEGRAAGLTPEMIPAEATGISEIHAPPLFGLGLVEALSTERVAATEDPDDRDGDGISGRMGRSADGRPALFGLKAVHPTLHSFIEGATRGELGLTTPEHPEEERAAGSAVPAAADPAPDPEVDAAFLEAVSAFVRLLAPPAAAVPEDRAAQEAARRGERVFAEAGCDGCHTPLWTTGVTTSAALSRKTFRAYSDFLLHDMGPGLADVCAVGVAPSEWRTARLVGLRLRTTYLHNGRAQRVEDAILLHGGEAQRSRDVFAALGSQERQDLLHFLGTL